jgi:hypothetical protein
MDGLPGNPRSNIYESPPGQAKEHTTPSTYTTPVGKIGHVALLFIARSCRCRRPHPPYASPAIPPRVRRHRSFSVRPNPVSAHRASGRRKPRVQTPVVSCYPAPAPDVDFVLLFSAPCDPHMTPLANGSLELGLLVSPILGGPARHRPFAPALHLHQRKSSRNLHQQYSAKSQSTPCCQSLITARSDHPPVLGRSGPQSPP